MLYCRLFLFVFLIFITTRVWADTAGPEAAFYRISQCTEKEDIAACREYITADSVGLYDRFASYGLMPCLPKGAAYVSKEVAGNQVKVRASITTGGKKRFMRLIFAEEEGQWRLDVPDTLHTAWGNDWEQRLNVMEQLYVMLRKKMGDQLNCSVVQNLAGGNH